MSHPCRSRSRRRGPTQDGIEEFLASEPWIEEFHKQCTDELWAAALQYAKHRAAVIRGFRATADDYYARELVQDALSDTYAGVLKWDPQVRELRPHIFLAILTRTNHDFERARKFRHESLDALDGDDEPLAGEIEAALRDGAPEVDPESAILRRQRWAQLWAAAAGHPTATAILRAIDDGAETREDIMREAQLSESDYHAGYVHLTRTCQPAAEAAKPARRRKGS